MINLYFLLVLAVTVFWQWGFSYSFRSDEVLGKPGDWMRKNFPEWVNKPLFDCPYCMASIHGSIFFFIFLSSYPLFMWPVFVVCCTGVSALVKD